MTGLPDIVWIREDFPTPLSPIIRNLNITDDREMSKMMINVYCLAVQKLPAKNNSSLSALRKNHL